MWGTLAWVDMGAIMRYLYSLLVRFLSWLFGIILDIPMAGAWACHDLHSRECIRRRRQVRAGWHHAPFLSDADYAHILCVYGAE
mgnify:FL=1